MWTILFGAMVLNGRSAFADPEPLPVTASKTSGPTPQPVASREEATAGLSGSADESVVWNEVAVANGPSWSWAVTAVQMKDAAGGWTNAVATTASISQSDSSSPAATLHFAGGPAYWKVTCTATCTYQDDTEVWTGSGNVDVLLTSVGVLKIVVNGSKPEDEGPTTILKGSGISLRALPNPTGAGYPSGKPTWAFDSQPSGSSLANPSAGETVSLSPTVLGEYRITATCGDMSDQFIFYLTEVKVQELTYSASTGSMYAVSKDDGGSYGTPHWKDANVNGDATETGDNCSPTAFVRGSKMQVSAKFKLAAGVTPGGTVKVKGTGPGNLTFAAVTGTAGSGVITTSGHVCDNAFANTVDFFGSEGYLEIAWQVSFDNGANWNAAGTTRNQVYVLYAAPLTTAYHMLAHLGCKNAKGDNTTANITSHIWGEFSDRDVRRMDGVQLKYYGSYDTMVTDTAGLLSAGDGQCGSWVSLFLDMRKVQGVTETQHYVTFESTTAGESFFVQSWTFAASGTSGVAGYPYLNVPNGSGLNATSTGYNFLYSEVTDVNGVAGQGNANPKAHFQNHQVAKIGGIYYDPSYGTTYSSLLGIDNGAIAAFYKIQTLSLNEATYHVDFNLDGDQLDTVTGGAIVVRTNPAGLNLSEAVGD